MNITEMPETLREHAAAVIAEESGVYKYIEQNPVIQQIRALDFAAGSWMGLEARTNTSTPDSDVALQAARELRRMHNISY